MAWRAADSLAGRTFVGLGGLDVTSNKDGQAPSDPDAKITKMKDGWTHLAREAEHAVDLDGGALVAVMLRRRGSLLHR